jgi:hypothetical protein
MAHQDSEDETTIPCIGVDRKKHLCVPHGEETVCGVKVLKKNPSQRELEGVFSCYQCTY